MYLTPTGSFAVFVINTSGELLTLSSWIGSGSSTSWLACVWAYRYAAVAIAFNDPYIR
jgi:hypothetical protein